MWVLRPAPCSWLHVSSNLSGDPHYSPDLSLFNPGHPPSLLSTCLCIYHICTHPNTHTHTRSSGLRPISIKSPLHPLLPPRSGLLFPLCPSVCPALALWLLLFILNLESLPLGEKTHVGPPGGSSTSSSQAPLRLAL